MHHGVLGQKWGVRRYQNEDGTRTAEGKQHRKKSVFISGSSKTQSKDSEYYRKELPDKVKKDIDKHMAKNHNIIVGEAPGIDSQVQKYLKEKNYKNVSVYTSYDKPRYLASKDWNVVNVDSKGHKPGSKEFLREKDVAMTKDADEGLSVILENGGAGATRNNVKRLLNQNKNVKVYMLNSDSRMDNWVSDILAEIGDKYID
jgi:hypothetical protein